MTGEWERKGECNHCGACCSFLFMQPVPQLLQVEGVEHGKEKPGYDQWHSDVRGVTGPDEQGRINVDAWLYRPCREFDQRASRCSIHPNKPETCIEWPWKPDQVVNTPCSYYFERESYSQEAKVSYIERRGGHGSPYPGVVVEIPGQPLMGQKTVEPSPPWRALEPMKEDEPCDSQHSPPS